MVDQFSDTPDLDSQIEPLLQQIEQLQDTLMVLYTKLSFMRDRARVSREIRAERRYRERSARRGLIIPIVDEHHGKL